MDKDAASAWAVLYGSIQTYDNAQGGVKPNQFKIDPADIGTFLNLVQSSLKSIMKTVALPLDDTLLQTYLLFLHNLLWSLLYQRSQFRPLLLAYTSFLQVTFVAVLSFLKSL